MERYPNGDSREELQQKLIRATLVPYAASFLLNEDQSALARRLEDDDTDLAKNIDEAELAPISTDSDPYEARALILGPVKIDDDYTCINLRALYCRANISTGALVEEPLELSVTADLGTPSEEAELRSDMTMSREPNPDDYSEIINLLTIARKSVENPDSHPLDPTMLNIVKEKYIWRLGSMFPSPNNKNMHPEHLENMLNEFFEAQHSKDTPLLSSELALRRTDDEGRHHLLVLNKKENDYELRFFDPNTKGLEIFVVGPYSENMVEEDVISELPTEKQAEVIKVLKTGHILDRRAFRLTYGADVEKAEVKLYRKQDGERFQEPSHFPDLDLG